MHSHPAKHNSTVAINALWCLLIALALLAFPIVARQARLQSGSAPKAASTTPTTQVAPQQTDRDTVLVTQTSTLPPPN